MTIYDQLLDESTVRGISTRRWARETLERLKKVAARKRQGAGNQAQASAINLSGEVTMRELNPPLQTDTERGEGDSTNSRMHKLIGGTR